MGIRIPRITINVDYGEEKALGDINVLALGFGMHQAWIYAAMFGTGTIFTAPGADSGAATHSSLVFLISIIVFGACLLLTGFLDRKLLHVFVQKKAIAIAAVLTCIGTLTVLASSAETTLGMILTVFSGVATGIGSAWMILYWGTAFSRRESTAIVMNTAIALVVAILIYSLLLHLIPYPVSGIVTACLPLAELAILWRVTPIPYSVRHAVPIFSQLNVKRGLFALRFCAPVFVFGLALGILRETSISMILPSATETDQIIMLLAAGIAMILIMVTVFTLGKNDPLNHLFRPLVPFIAIAVFSLPFSGSGYFIFADLLLLVAYLCFEALMWMFFGELSQGMRLSPMFVFGLGRGSLALGSLAGSNATLGTGILDVLPFGEAGVAILVLLAMVIAYALLPREKDIRDIVLPHSESEEREVARINNENLLETSHDDEGSGEGDQPRAGRFRMRCEAVANTYLLSHRETEVMFLLAKGNNSALIQEKLFISEGTAKTHIRHIYRKLDIHSQQELVRIVDEQDIG